MPLATDIRIVAFQAFTPLGRWDDLWEALLRGECAFGRIKRFESDYPIGFTLAKAPGDGVGGHLALHAKVKGGVKSPEPRPENSTSVWATTKGRAGGGEGKQKVVDTWATRRSWTPWRYVSSACASGALSAIESAELLIDGERDEVVAVGYDAVTPFIIDGFKALNALSSKPSRPFDRRRDGLCLGEGSAGVVLRRASDLEHPEEYPRIISYGCSNDANHISGPSRDGSGLALAIERALAGIDKSEIRAICAHGTATEYNDAMEARAFHTVFNGNPPPVFGIKGAIGHTLGAAGLIEVIVSALVATEGLIPPTVGFEQGEEEYPLDVVHGEPRRIQPGYVLTTNSGFGGMNTAIVIGPGKP